LKLLGLETWPPDAPKVSIFAIFKAYLQKYISFLFITKYNIASFAFVKKPFNLILGKLRYVRSKLGAFHVTGRYFSNGPHFPGAENHTANFAGQGSR
jgi:hypothetical protein